MTEQILTHRRCQVIHNVVARAEREMHDALIDMENAIQHAEVARDAIGLHLKMSVLAERTRHLETLALNRADLLNRRAS